MGWMLRAEFSDPLRVNPDGYTQNMEIDAGTVIDSRFTIISPLGSGGMGSVFLAQQTGLDRQIAVKFLDLPSRSEAVERRKRFEREAQVLTQLSHKNIVSFYGYGFWNTRPYIMLENVPGTALDQMLGPGGLSVSQCLEIFDQICEALEYAHGKGLFHRDLKPSNIMVASDQSVKLIDFGLAKLKSSTDGEQALTQEGIAIGTVAYMSPEQCRGEWFGARSDIYALGCMLFDCLTGYPPFDGNCDIAIMHKHSFSECPKIGQIKQNVPFEQEFDGIIGKCLEKEPENRYESVAEVREALAALRQLIAGEKSGARGISIRSYVGKLIPAKLRANKLTSVSISILTLSAVVVGGYSISVPLLRKVDIQTKMRAAEEQLHRGKLKGDVETNLQLARALSKLGDHENEPNMQLAAKGKALDLYLLTAESLDDPLGRESILKEACTISIDKNASGSKTFLRKQVQAWMDCEKFATAHEAGACAQRCFVKGSALRAYLPEPWSPDLFRQRFNVLQRMLVEHIGDEKQTARELLSLTSKYRDNYPSEYAIALIRNYNVDTDLDIREKTELLNTAVHILKKRAVEPHQSDEMERAALEQTANVLFDKTDRRLDAEPLLVEAIRISEMLGDPTIKSLSSKIDLGFIQIARGRREMGLKMLLQSANKLCEEGSGRLLTAGLFAALSSEFDSKTRANYIGLANSISAQTPESPHDLAILKAGFRRWFTHFTWLYSKEGNNAKIEQLFDAATRLQNPAIRHTAMRYLLLEVSKQANETNKREFAEKMAHKFLEANPDPVESEPYLIIYRGLRDRNQNELALKCLTKVIQIEEKQNRNPVGLAHLKREKEVFEGLIHKSQP
jgi:serine/threonine protein kinase